MASSLPYFPPSLLPSPPTLVGIVERNRGSHAVSRPGEGCLQLVGPHPSVQGRCQILGVIEPGGLIDGGEGQALAGVAVVDGVLGKEGEGRKEGRKGGREGGRC